MALSLRQIKNRIRGIENVKKITHAMEMISIAKLRPAQSQLISFRNYSLKMEELLKNLLADSRGIIHPLVNKRAQVKKVALCVVTSDTGLCSTHNLNIMRMAEDFIGKIGAEKTLLLCLGKKGMSYFKKKGLNIISSFTELQGRYSPEVVNKILSNLTDIYSSGKADEVYIAYTYFESVSRHRPRIEKILNIETDREEKTEFLFEPGIDAILDELVPAYIFNKIKLIILNAFASEHSTRAMAMGEATENARGLLEDLTLLRNKVRQANITKEILEVVSSAEALR